MTSCSSGPISSSAGVMGFFFLVRLLYFLRGRMGLGKVGSRFLRENMEEKKSLCWVLPGIILKKKKTTIFSIRNPSMVAVSAAALRSIIRETSRAKGTRPSDRSGLHLPAGHPNKKWLEHLQSSTKGKFIITSKDSEESRPSPGLNANISHNYRPPAE